MKTEKQQYSDEQLEQKAQEATLILDSEVFKDAIKEIQNRLFSELVNSNLREVQTREHCYVQLKALDDIESQIKTIVQQFKRKERKMRPTI